MRLQQMTERISDWRAGEVVVDPANRTVRNIALVGRESRNGYQYSREALTAAVGLYEHKPVFLDHGERLAKPYERSTRDLVGSICNVRMEQDRIRGDIAVLETEAGRTFLALAQAEHIPVGMSHVVLAQRSPDRTRVERIEDVVSVDAVMYPATTRTFRESLHANEAFPGSFDDLTDRIAEGLPDHLARIGDECSRWTLCAVYPGRVILAEFESSALKQLSWTVEGDRIVFADRVEDADRTTLSLPLWEPNSDPDHRALIAERDRLKSELERLQLEIAVERQREARSLDVERLLRDERMPESEVTDSLRARLMAAAEPHERLRLLREHRELAATLRERTARSHLRRTSPGGPTDRDIVETIRGGSAHRRVV